MNDSTKACSAPNERLLLNGFGAKPAEDPLSLFPRLGSWLYSRWLVWTYPFASVGEGFSAQSSCQLRRSGARHIKIGNGVRLDRDVWLNIISSGESDEAMLLLDDGCAVGRQCIMSVQNRIHVERNSIFGPSVLLIDHDAGLEHAVNSAGSPEKRRGGGTIRIEEGCWLGFRAAVISTEGDLVIGKNSVIGANSVVTHSVPPFSIVAGNPGKIVKHYEVSSGAWVLGSSSHRGRG